MENIHGVDVSWLHRQTNGVPPNASKPLMTEASNPPVDASRKPIDGPIHPNGIVPAQEGRPPTQNTTDQVEKASQALPSQQTPKSSPRRPGLLGRTSFDKSGAAETTGGSAPVLKKRPSWMLSLSSKLSSSGSSKTTNTTKDVAQSTSSTNKSGPSQSVAGIAEPQKTTLDAGSSAIVEEGQSTEDSESYFNSSPKASSGSFLSSTFRRLSSGGSLQVPAGAQADTPQCQRKTLNVDQGRPRLAIKGLNPADLRRVSFSVDVEIAGSSRYTADQDTNPDALDPKAKKKEKKLKERGEGDALKHPEAAKEQLETNNVSSAFPETPGGNSEKQPSELSGKADNPSNSSSSKRTDILDHTKKDSQEQTSQTKLTTGKETPGQAPAAQDTSTNAGDTAPVRPRSNTAAKSKDKPTTDPLRIYRRCCQLREAPVLKRISEQLGQPSNYSIEAPGVVMCLNLNRSRMQLTDIVCLGDWLAVVPVKKLLLDDANLTDEGLRVILAGLLAAKPPELQKRKRGRSSPSRLRDSTVTRTPGIIEKLTLKNNRKLTVTAWKYICTFLNLSQSIQAIDFTMVPFPQTGVATSNLGRGDQASVGIDELLFQSLSTRLGGDRLAELTFGECGLEDQQVSKIASAATKIRLQRLGLAGNRISATGLEQLALYLKEGYCKGLDLGGVDLHNQLAIILDALDDDSLLQALSVANCNLDTNDLKPMFEKLVMLPDFRFLDLSHNHELFSRKPTSLSLLRYHLPRLQLLKRLHLMDVSLSLADAIGIAEIVPETRNLAHLSLLENPQLAQIALATDASTSEEASALFMSLMTAVRLSKTMVCVDIEVPGKDASEVVRALARQVIAYCLRNMNSLTQGDAIRVADAAAALPDVSEADTSLLQDLGGYEEEINLNGQKTSAKSEDYLVGGQGWVKALSHCLNAKDVRRISVDDGSASPHMTDSEAGKATAKEMSKNLLTSARNFRQRLQLVLAEEEARESDGDVLRRLQFLDQTITSIIERFEREFPDTRLPIKSTEEMPPTDGMEAIDTSTLAYSPETVQDPPPGVYISHSPISPMKSSSGDSSRRGSATDLASFALASEEAKIHKLGHRVKREVLPPAGMEDRLYGTSSQDPQESKYLSALRKQMEAMDSEEWREKVRKQGWEATLKEISDEKDRLKSNGISDTT